MTPAEATLQSRITNSSHRETVKQIFGQASRLAAERSRLAADRNLSDEGRRGQESAFAKSLVKNLAELTRPVRRARSELAAKRAQFKLPALEKTDAVAELRRQEIRAYLRGLPIADRVAALDTLGDDAVLAVIDASPALSGLPPDRHAFVESRYLERQFGSQMRDLEAIDEDHAAVEAAAQMVRRDLQIATGLGDADFSALEKSHAN